MAIDKKTESPPDLESAVQEYLKKGTPESKEKLLKISRDIANYYASIYSHDKSDSKLIRAANEGFIIALKKFDPEREILFSTYATHCIISEIRQELRSRNIFKIPEWLKKLQDDVINATEELAQKKAALPTLKEIAGRVNIAEQGVLATMQAGSVPMEEINISSIRSLKHETFKLPIEDVITIRKSMDRLSNIQKKVLSLISINLKELSLAIEEEESALTKSQVDYLRMIEDYTGNFDNSNRNFHIPINSFKIAFPDEYEEAEVLRYFEVLSDEFGLRLSEIRCMGKPEKNGEVVKVPLNILFEGRYRGLLQLLDHLRKSEDKVYIEKVRTTRSEQIPARISIMIRAMTQFQKA